VNTVWIRGKTVHEANRLNALWGASKNAEAHTDKGAGKSAKEDWKNHPSSQELEVGGEWILLPMIRNIVGC